MEIAEVLTKLDALFATGQIAQVEQFLLESLECAKQEADKLSCITIYNELMGYYRELGSYDAAIACSEHSLRLTKEVGMLGTLAHGMGLVNAANAYRAARRLEEATQYFQDAENIYRHNMEDTDIRMAGFYNNRSLLQQEKLMYQEAICDLNRALEILKQYPQATVELARTRVNLAASYLKLGEAELAEITLKEAYDFYESQEEKDYHYPAVLFYLGEAAVLKAEWSAAYAYYQKAELIFLKTGERNHAYAMVCENLSLVCMQIGNEEESQRYQEKSKEILQEITK